MNSHSEFFFKSPDKKNVLIVEQHNFMSNYCSFYKRKYIIFKEPLSSYSVYSENSMYKPFSHQQYSISWLDNNRVTLSLSFEKYKDIGVRVSEPGGNSSIYEGNRVHYSNEQEKTLMLNIALE